MSTQARPSAKGRMGGSQKKYARGDYVNILMGVEDAPEVNPRGLPFDPLAMVATGLKDLHGEMGPDAVLRRRRAERAKLPRPTAPTEKAFSLSDAPMLQESRTSPARDKLLRQHTSIDTSAKLSQLNDWFSPERVEQRELQKIRRRPIESPKTTRLLSAKSVPDLRRSLTRMGMTNRWTAISGAKDRSRATAAMAQMRELIYSSDPIPDLACYDLGIMEVEVSSSRAKVDHCLRASNTIASGFKIPSLD